MIQQSHPVPPLQDANPPIPQSAHTRRRILGWTAVGLSTLVSGFWAFWGIVENFHEGWYHESVWGNLGLMLVQYLSPMLLFMAMALIALKWPRIGGALHVAAALIAMWFFHVLSNPGLLILITPLIGLGALYAFGDAQPRRRAALLLIGLPLLTLLIAGAAPALRVAQRIDDGDRGARIVEGRDVRLVWAPQGPGWPRSGTDWHDAQDICQHLSEDGLTLQATPQDIWRLPTVDEAVRSMARHGENSGGEWDAASAQATYSTHPDKESPLWDVHSPVIYWWTASEVDAEQAYIIVYDGKVWPRRKTLRPDYLGFRCVKTPSTG